MAASPFSVVTPSELPSRIHRQSTDRLIDYVLHDVLDLQVSWLTVAGVRGVLHVRKVLLRLFAPPHVRWAGRLQPGPCPAPGGRLKLNFDVFGATLRDGYEIESVGPTKCPVLSRPELLAQWSQGRYADDLKQGSEGRGAAASRDREAASAAKDGTPQRAVDMQSSAANEPATVQTALS
jgi:hypothetical protein